MVNFLSMTTPLSLRCPDGTDAIIVVCVTHPRDCPSAQCLSLSAP